MEETQKKLDAKVTRCSQAVTHSNINPCPTLLNFSDRTRIGSLLLFFLLFIVYWVQY